MVYWQVTRKKTWYTGKLQERMVHGILVSYKKEYMDTGKLQERIHGILVSYKKEDMVYW